MKKQIIIIFTLALIVLPFIGAYDLGAVKQGNCVDLYQHCYTCSYVNITSIKFPNQTIIYLNEEMTKNGYDFTYNYCNNNLSGEYFYTVCGDPTDANNCATFSYVVTESGLEMTSQRTNSSLGLIGLLCLFFIISLVGLFKIEDYKGKFALYWVSHVLIILICFVAWQTGVEGLLEGTALTGIFKIFFWIFTVASFPMLLLSIAWMFYIHTVNDHTKRLMEKGEDPETAFKLAKRKTRRKW